MNTLVERPVRLYEGIIILHPDVNETEQKALFKRNTETITKYQGRVNHLDTWGKRRLANPINKMKLGQYFHTTFEAKAECVGELERLLKIDDRVLRFFHTRLDERKPLNSYVEDFKKTLAESIRREQEKDAKRDARRAAMGPGGPREGGGGGDRGGRGGGGGFRRRDEEDGEEGE